MTRTGSCRRHRNPRSGRYKAASVEQILTGWQRRGEAKPRFSADFAAMVLGKVEASSELLEDSDLNESLLDAEIISCTESTTNPPFVDLSSPVLDEDQNGAGEGSISTPFFTSTLMASPYPPLPLRKPDDHWQETEVEGCPAPPENFTPSSQFSQFYYRLLAMADTAPGHKAPLQIVGFIFPSDPTFSQCCRRLGCWLAATHANF